LTCAFFSCYACSNKQNKYINYTTLQFNNQERGETLISKQKCVSITHISSAKVETKPNLDDWIDEIDRVLVTPCYTKKKEVNNNNSKKLLKKLTPPSNNHSDNYSKKVCESESETSLYFISFSIF